MEEQKKNLNANTIIIVATIIVAALIIGGSIWASKNNGGPSASNPPVVAGGLDIGEAPVLGDPQAPNTIVEFLDFQCPYCEQFFATTEPELRAKYIDTGKAKLVFKALTFIDSFDSNRAPMESLLAAKAGECAKEQGKYVAMHDAIYNAERAESDAKKNPENSGNLTEAFFASTASAIGLDVAAFNDCTQSAGVTDLLEVYSNDADAAMGGRISTPTVFVNGTKIENPFDLAAYEALIK